MNSYIKYSFKFSLGVFLISLLVHILAIFQITVISRFPVFILHVLTIGVCFIAFFQLRSKEGPNIDLAKYFKEKFSGKLNWVPILLVLLFIYNFINFFLGFSNYVGTPDIWDGKYVLHDHGSLIREITEKEYRLERTKEIKMFSSFWVLFSGVSSAMLYERLPHFPFQSSSH